MIFQNIKEGLHLDKQVLLKRKKKAKEPDNMVQMQSESLDREWMLSLIVKVNFVAFFR